ncbi:hypothetical protein D3C87_1946360 [compost metagenome]
MLVEKVLFEKRFVPDNDRQQIADRRARLQKQVPRPGRIECADKAVRFHFAHGIEKAFSAYREFPIRNAVVEIVA